MKERVSGAYKVYLAKKKGRKYIEVDIFTRTK